MATAVTPHPLERPLLGALAAVQIGERKIAFFTSGRGVAASALTKFLLGYLLIGYSGGVESGYYLLLLLPLVSAAAAYGPLGSILFTAVACGAYLSFLVWIDWDRYSIAPDQIRELCRRLAFFALIGYLSNTLAAAAREQSRRYKTMADELAAANRNLLEAEDAVRRSDRLAALGQLSAGLAHELRNPLATIKGSAEMLGRSLAEGSEVAREMAGFISTEVDRTNQIVTRFLEFARPIKLRREPEEITAVLDRAIGEVSRTVGCHVQFSRNYSPDLGPVPIDADLIERVFANLLANAAQASPEGAEVTVKTLLAGREAEISIIDRGAGIAPKNLESIFNPFFTTKADGVGLGLAIVSKLVDEHGGRIAAESEVSKGSVFRVYLPIE